MKSCRDCKWFEYHTDKPEECGMPGTVAKSIHMARYHNYFCGRQAKYFEPKPTLWRWLKKRFMGKPKPVVANPNIEAYKPEGWKTP